MKIDLIDIDNALKYYRIDDIKYKNKCHKCVEDINLANKLRNRIEEIYNILYDDSALKIDTLWERQNMAELFGNQYNPFVTNILVLLGYRLHDKNMENKNYDDLQKELYKKRVRETLTNDIYTKKLSGIRISQMIWAAYFINTKLIEVGRLQYEKCENHIKIHIPSGSKLEIGKVINSIKDSKEEIEKYFKITNIEYRCDSWLLSNQINSIIDKNSNIAKFYRLFEVKDGSDATKDILNFVFDVQKCDNYSKLKGDTRLQKILKQQLIEKKEIKIGLGILKNLNICSK